MDNEEYFYAQKDFKDSNHLKRIDKEMGNFRTVYKILSDKFGEQYKGKVLKKGPSNRSISVNRAEFHTWMAVKGTKLDQYFCPIRHKSDSFEFLIMDYADIDKTTSDDILQFKKDIESTIKMNNKAIDCLPGLDIDFDNVGFHEDRGLVLIDYSWGANFNIDK